MIGRTEKVSGELLKIQKNVLSIVLDYGLDPFDTIFEVCDYDTINILAAQGGFPNRYPHWRFGMEYDQLSKGYEYGMQKIYEMVINTDPSYAYLLKGNNLVDQKLVMSHVYGHVDFFKNNAWFSNTNRKMMDVMANHGTKIRRYMEQFGQDTVESFIDRVLSLENLIDINNLFKTPDVAKNKYKKSTEEEATQAVDQGSLALQSFMRSKKRREKTSNKKNGDQEEVLVQSKLERPQRDILQFLAEESPIAEWQADIMAILREESYYFLPQRLTKIMNEGWASYWHSKIMTEKVLRASEVIDFADRHSGVTAMSRQQINPYKIGIELMRDIEYRWDTGRYGKQYQDCDSMVERHNWDKKLGAGREKIFEVRRTHNDITFIDEYLTPEFCERQQIFTYKFNPRTGRFEIDTRDFLAIKQKLLTSLTNFGSPVIEIENANFENRGELLLSHKHYGVDLDMGYAQDTMRNIYAIWKRPVNLVTKYDDKEVIFVYDGKELRPLNAPTAPAAAGPVGGTPPPAGPSRP